MTICVENYLKQNFTDYNQQFSCSIKHYYISDLMWLVQSI